MPNARLGGPRGRGSPRGNPAPGGRCPAPAEVPAAGAWALVRTLRLPNPGAASLDRRGGLYVADADNNIRQFGPEGLPLNTYAPAQPGHVAQLEAYNLTNTLVFYDDRQQLVLLDRFLAPAERAAAGRLPRRHGARGHAGPRQPDLAARREHAARCASSTPARCAWCKTRRSIC
ncbi:MAG: hypothetical protein WKG07_20185 [Hymenobacter sp.]